MFPPLGRFTLLFASAWSLAGAFALGDPSDQPPPLSDAEKRMLWLNSRAPQSGSAAPKMTAVPRVRFRANTQGIGPRPVEVQPTATHPSDSSTQDVHTEKKAPAEAPAPPRIPSPDDRLAKTSGPAASKPATGAAPSTAPAKVAVAEPKANPEPKAKPAPAEKVKTPAATVAVASPTPKAPPAGTTRPTPAALAKATPVPPASSPAPVKRLADAHATPAPKPSTVSPETKPSPAAVAKANTTPVPKASTTSPTKPVLVAAPVPETARTASTLKPKPVIVSEALPAEKTPAKPVATVAKLTTIPAITEPARPTPAPKLPVASAAPVVVVAPTPKPSLFKPQPAPARDIASNRYPWRNSIVTTVFWVGEPVSGRNFTPNFASSWDSHWSANYGGFDNPDPGARRNFIPVKFTPRQNPFYVALPYNDVTHGTTKPEARMVIPWFKEDFRGEGQSVCHDRWVAIRNRSGHIAYAQWSDCGPFRTDHWQYVFGNDRPKPNLNAGAGLDVSPAVRDFLGLGSTDVTDWKFVDAKEVPVGPWASYGENNTVLAMRGPHAPKAKENARGAQKGGREVAAR